ncbi:MAG: hypothetical protein GY853_01415 [PVC group bacterium]|nr:hypothetical protein [PVC group bacterium]
MRGNSRIQLEEAAFETEDAISVTEAMREAGVSRPTLIAWARKYKIGIQRVERGTWIIFPDKLALLLRGELKSGSKY